MRPLPSLLSAVILAVAGTAAHSAELERAPELPDLSFRSVSQSHSTAAPVPGVPVAEQAKAAACPVLDLSGAQLANKGAFNTDKKIVIGGSTVGTIDSEDGESVYKDAHGNVAAKKAADGAVTDCSGAKIGSIEERYASEASVFTIKDAAGQIVAQTGAVDDIGFVLPNAARVDKDHWYSDTVTLTIRPGFDPRLVALASAQNTASVYKRAAQRRSEREPAGGHRL